MIRTESESVECLLHPISCDIFYRPQTLDQAKMWLIYTNILALQHMAIFPYSLTLT